MKPFITLLLVVSGIISMNAQSSNINEAYRFNKFMEKISTPKGQLTYADIRGNAYYNAVFMSAKVQNATTLMNVRYNKYTDAIEILNDGNIYVLPKSEKYSRIAYANSPAVFVYLDSGEMQGYFYEVVPGKTRLLKKLKTEFRPEVPAVNTFTSAIPPKFENVKPVYYFETNNQFIKIPKNTDDLIKQFTENRSEIAAFIKSNKLKISKEEDLIRLAQFLNK
ncbi:MULTISPECIES: hypothetical protein [unclassified Kaistella]|uniref:hypothetical protein n=1 Tax=unclassified Kaistella TaxID=2762626 RepID=UPI00273571EF|nr:MULTISPECIES: hypothetical protein [unclassified Kaistella]MDP2454386.1 hypothetical protein [Kaistella sp. SH11-4b]MDP2457873.1 hypothetical protein [Kaistella sp. SH40-3]MDP2460779.1 hypothetical protein [Kaistella sp. SH19-2b]